MAGQINLPVEHFQLLFETAPGSFLILWPNENFTIVGASNAYLRDTLTEREAIIGKEIFEVFPDNPDAPSADATKNLRASLERVRATKLPDTMAIQRYDIPNPDRRRFEERYWSPVNVPVVSPEGDLLYITHCVQDVTDYVRLDISNERWKLAVEEAGDGVWDWNILTNEVVYSKRCKEILGYGPDETPDRFFEQWESRIHPDDRDAVLDALRLSITGAPYHSEYRLQHKDGSWKWVLARTVVVRQDDAGKPVRMSGTLSDISQKKESEELIWRHASFDTLTGLPNRRLFRDRLEQEVRKAHRSGLGVALLFIDLDRFKEVNDWLGHDAGDMLLVQAANRLNACVRDSDTVARIGGDEFTVILTELSDKAHVEHIAQKIINTLAEPFRLNDDMAYVAGSIGITLYPIDADDPEELIRNADQAMYAAKRAGRNQFSYFTRSMQEEAHMRLRLSGDLRKALSEGQMQVHYQPVVELHSHYVAKAEALLRWYHPKLGLVKPVLFIPIAEESGLINEIGDWVFKEAAARSRQWANKTGRPFEIGVNRSPVQFLSQSKGMSWPDYLAEIGVPPNSISVEITESMLLNALPVVENILLQYRDAGIHVALDDFGTGYSSMAYLKKFDIDYVKIDQSFVRDIDVNAGSRAIAESIIVMAHKLGLKVIAEGIETLAQEEILRMAGCDYGQGYLFSNPVPPETFEELLGRRTESAG